MKRATLLAFIVVFLILSEGIISNAAPKSKADFDGIQQDKGVKRAKTSALTTGGTKTGGNGQGGSQQDTAVVKPPLRKGKLPDSLRHFKKIKH